MSSGLSFRWEISQSEGAPSPVSLLDFYHFMLLFTSEFSFVVSLFWDVRIPLTGSQPTAQFFLQ